MEKVYFSEWKNAKFRCVHLEDFEWTLVVSTVKQKAGQIIEDQGIFGRSEFKGPRIRPK